MNPQPDTLRDRITDAQIVDLYWRTTGDDWAIPDRVMVAFARAVLAETTAVQPEADAVERAKRVFDQRLADVRDEYHRRQMLWDKERDRLTAALAAAQPVEPEPRPRVEWAVVEGVRILMPVSEPDEREALGQAIFGTAIGRPLTVEQIDLLTDAILAAGFRRSRPEVTHTVTAAQVWDAANVADDTVGPDEGFPWYVAFLAALGVTVADTPGGDTCWCPQCGKDH